MTRRLKVRILGSGCSTGVPRIDGYWGACDPENPRNRRSRCSAWFGAFDEATPEVQTSVVIDTAPEFREQMVRASISQVDSILWTHDHADQTHGLDDMRAFTFRNGPIDGYFDRATHDTLTARFNYAFTGKFGYPPICVPNLIPPHGQPWSIRGEGGPIPVLTFDQVHGPIRSVGYRLGDIAYSSDISDMPEESFEALQGLGVWIVDALRYKPHPTHSHLEKTLAWISRVKPKLAVLTNLHQDMDYEDVSRILPGGVVCAYDGFTALVDL